jgi:hypothetical protein
MQYVECDCANNSQRASGQQRAAKINIFLLWPDGVIKYRNHNCPSIELMIAAMREWVTAANNKIQFVEIKDNGWNRFVWSIGCSYHVCLQQHNNNYGGKASLACVPWAFVNIGVYAGFATCLHELGHTLGLVHEIQRCDRDNYITIDWSNIRIGDAVNFMKLPNTIASPYGAFDISSIMMYQQNASAIDGTRNTIYMNDGASYIVPGTLSSNDIQHINLLY